MCQTAMQQTVQQLQAASLVCDTLCMANDLAPRMPDPAPHRRMRSRAWLWYVMHGIPSGHSTHRLTSAAAPGRGTSTRS